MTTLTLDLDDDLVARLARMAEARHVRVEEVAREALSAAAERADARTELRRLVEEAPLALEPGWKWNREDLYDRPALLWVRN